VGVKMSDAPPTGWGYWPKSSSFRRSSLHVSNSIAFDGGAEIDAEHATEFTDARVLRGGADVVFADRTETQEALAKSRDHCFKKAAAASLPK